MRKILSIIAIFGLLVSCNGNKSQDKKVSTDYKPAKVLDFEHHIFAPEVIDYMKGRTEYPMWKDGFGIIYRENAELPLEPKYRYQVYAGAKSFSHLELITDLDDSRIKFMDFAGVTCAMLSTGDGVEGLPKEDAVRLARATNDAVAAAIKRHPGRYQGTICLPMPYVEESIAELERAVNELGLKYWHTHANYGEHHLYDPELEPVLAKCAELGVPFYLHPTSPSCDYLTDSGIAFSSAGFGFGVETMKTSIKLIIGGLFDRYPSLKMILGHMAEFYPYCLDRMDNRFFIYRGYDPELKCKNNFAYYFKNKNIFMTTSGIFDFYVIGYTIRTIGVDNILFGSDYPYEDFKGAVDFIKNLPITDEEKDKIFYKNAETYILK